jgi:hypothetical protein
VHRYLKRVGNHRFLHCVRAGAGLPENPDDLAHNRGGVRIEPRPVFILKQIEQTVDGEGGTLQVKQGVRDEPARAASSA